MLPEEGYQDSQQAQDIYLNLSAGTDTNNEGQFFASEGWMTKFLDCNGHVLC